MIAVNKMVEVAVDGGKPGIVKYITKDGYVGVSLVNEGKRVDEWPMSMVTAITPQRAAQLAMNFVKVG